MQWCDSGNLDNDLMKDNSTSLNNEQETIFANFFTQRLDSLHQQYQDQQSRGLHKGEKPILEITGPNTTSQDSEVTDSSARTLNIYKLPPKKVYDIFNKVADQYMELKQSNMLDKQQDHLRSLIEISVSCARYIIRKGKTNSKHRRIFRITQNMFTDYFSLFKDDRKTLRLHLNYQDTLKDREFYEVHSLSNLLENNDSVNDEREEELDSKTIVMKESPQKTSSQKQSLDESYSYEHLAKGLKELKSGATRNKVLLIELTNLSNTVGLFIHQNRHVDAEERKQQLILGLVIEEYRIQQMQQSSHENLHALTKSIKKAAKYFESLYTNYRHSDETDDLKSEIKKSSQLMDARASNFEQMLACHHVETSKETSVSEKENAQKRRLQYAQENSDNIRDLCRRYEGLMSNNGLTESDHESFDKMSDEDKYNYLTLQILNIVDFDLLQKSKKYLINIHCQFLSELQHTSDEDLQGVIMTYENLQDVDTLPMQKLHIVALLTTELGQKLQDAIQVYNTIKSKFLQKVKSKYPTNTYIANESFCADFRLKAYDYLFQACLDENKPNDMELMERNCWDILGAGEYRSPILVLLAKYKLSSLEKIDTNDEESYPPKDDYYETQESSLLESGSTQTQLVEVDDNSETVWEQLCSSHNVETISFKTYLDSINRDNVISEEVADFLYKVLMNQAKRLLVDYSNIDIFVTLYQKIAKDYFTPLEFTELEKTVGENIVHGKKQEPIKSEAMMVKAINIYDEIIRYISIFKPELLLKFTIAKLLIFYDMRCIVSQRGLSTKCEEALKDAQKYIHLEQNKETIIRNLNLVKVLRQVIKSAPQETEIQKMKAVASYSRAKYHEDRKDLITKAKHLSLEALDLKKRIYHVLRSLYQHTVLLQFASFLHVIINYEKENNSILTLLFAVNTQIDYFEQLHKSHTYEILMGFLESQTQTLRQVAGVLSIASSLKKVEISRNDLSRIEYGMIKGERSNILEDIQSELICCQHFKTLLPNFESIDEVSKLQQSFMDLNLGPNIYILKNLTDACKESLERIAHKQYWQAFLLVGNENNAAACYIKASVSLWFYNLLSAPALATTLSLNEEHIKSTLTFLKNKIDKYVKKAKKEAMLKESSSYIGKFKHKDLEAIKLFKDVSEDNLESSLDDLNVRTLQHYI